MFLAARKRRLVARGGTATEKIEFRDPGAREEGSDGRARREEGRGCGTSESRVPARGDDSSFAARATLTTSDRACLRNTCCRIRG